MISNFKFEVDFNIEKIDSFLKELEKYRNKVNGDSLSNYFGYFPLSKIIAITIGQMFFTDSIYKYLDHENIGKLQNFLTDFSLNSEQYMNNQINSNRTNIINNPTVKQLAISDIEFWEDKFNDSKTDLQTIKDKFK